MKIEILDQALLDLKDGAQFYESQETGLGEYFLENLISDIETLRVCAGVHRQAYKNLHRMLSKRFPYAVFYSWDGSTVRVCAILDCRREPTWIRHRLQ